MNQPHVDWRGEKTSRESPAVICPACSAAARRADAHFCATCGRGLRESVYAPADSLLASYHQQHSRPAMLIEQEMSGAVGGQHATASRRREASDILSGGSALVIVILAFVPFIGILFCPLAVVTGAIRLRRAPDAQGWRRVAVFNIICGILIFGAQAFWWGIIYLFAQ